MEKRQIFGPRISPTGKNLKEKLENLFSYIGKGKELILIIVSFSISITYKSEKQFDVL